MQTPLISIIVPNSVAGDWLDANNALDKPFCRNNNFNSKKLYIGISGKFIIKFGRFLGKLNTPLILKFRNKF